jgi:thioredoxin 1
MSDLVKHITDAEFETVIANGITLVDFWAPWCGPCKKIGPILDELAAEYGDRLTIAKINLDENKAVANQFGIMSIPTLILFKDGQKVEQKTGAAPKPALKAFIDQAF